MASNQDALDAIKDIKEAIAEYGSDITLEVAPTDAIRDSYGIITTPGTDGKSIPMKALISTSATDGLLSKLTNDVLNSYGMALRIYTTEEINKEDYQVNFRGKKYAISFIDEKILQNTTYMYEILTKR